MNAEIVLPKPLSIATWIARVIVAVILLQTLFLKFSGAPESIYIFTTVGQEPWGRFGSGVVELIASILLFVPRGVAIGALLAAGTMSGAIFFHLTKLGVVVNDDGGLLFSLALVVLVCATFLLWVYRSTLPLVGARL
jgi:putative oxidoreductase